MSDARQTPPSFNEMVGLLEKLFKDSLDMTKAFTAAETEEGWQRYKTLNHLFQDPAEHNTEIHNHGLQLVGALSWLLPIAEELYADALAKADNKQFLQDTIGEKLKACRKVLLGTFLINKNQQ